MSRSSTLDYGRQRLAELCPSLPSDLIEELTLGWRVFSFGRREELAPAGRIHL